MTKSNTLSLTTSVKSLLSILIFFGIQFSAYTQQVDLTLEDGESITLEVSQINGINVTGEGSIILESNGSDIQIYDDVHLSEGVKLFSDETVQFYGPGEMQTGRIHADVFIEGNWDLQSDLRMAPGFEAHFHDARLQMFDNDIIADDILFTGMNLIHSESGRIVVNESLISSNNVEIISEDQDLIIAPATASIIGLADVPVSFYSVVANTCGDVPFTITTQPISNYNGPNISCNGAADGIAEVTIVGGVGPFTFQWFGGPQTNNTGSTYGGLAAGTYSVIVTDEGQGPDNGDGPEGISCIDGVQLTEPAPLAVFAMNLSVPTCADICNGTAFPIILGGTGSYSFEYSNGVTNQVALNLCAGENTLEIRDFNQCLIDTTFILPVDTIFPGLVFTDSLCFGDNTGSASVSPSGGGGEPFTVEWSNGNMTDEITGLSAGTYTVSVTDRDDCVQDSTFTIVEIPEIMVTLDSSTSPVCVEDTDGTIEITVTGGELDFILVWNLNGEFFSNDEDLSDLGVGTYDLSVVDDFGCEQTFSITLESEEEITAEVVSTPIDCFENCNATITATVTQGQEPILYNWTDANGFISDQSMVQDLCSGVYNLEITDATGCTYTETITIEEPEEITMSETVNDITCFGLSDGSIELIMNGGDAPFTMNFPFTEIAPNELVIENLGAGFYDVEVRDANDCLITGSYEITEPEEIVITPTPTNPTCALESTGSISILIEGGNEPYGIEWVELAVFDTDEVTDLAAGDYTVIVTDGEGCEETMVITLEDPDEITATEDITDVLCAGENSGSITIVLENNMDPIEISWSGPSVVTATDLNQFDLLAGTYTLNVTDTNGCTFSSDYEVAEEEEIVIEETITQPLCFGELGEISISIIGGVEPYQILWDPLGLNDVTTVSDLAEGFYTVTVIDANLCELSAEYEIIAPEEITITETISQPTCTDPAGQIEIEIAGGTEPYNVVWTGNGVEGSDQLSISDLEPGDYSVEVTDAAGAACLVTGSYTLDEPGELEVVETITDVSCFGETNGSIELEITGAIDPVAINWVGAVLDPAAEDQFDLAAGIYSVEITNGDGCSFQMDYEVLEPIEIEIITDVTQPGCDATTGEATITIENAADPVSIEWVELGLFDVTTVTDLLPGDYTVNVTDNNSCFAETVITIEEPGTLDVTVEVTDVLCNGEQTGSLVTTVVGGVEPLSVNWTNVGLASDLDQFNLAAGTYELTISDADGCEFNETYEITEPEVIDIEETITQAQCEGELGEISVNITGGMEPYQIEWQGIAAPDQTLISDLTPGNYTIVVTDGNGCLATESYEIDAPIEIEITEAITQPGCEGDLGQIEITDITDGIANYTLNWVELGLNTALITDLTPGDYTLEVTNGDGCTASEVYTITEPGILDVSAEITQVICNAENNGSITLTASGGEEPYTAVWTPDLGTSLIQADLAPGTYDVEVSDANGCSFTATYEITEPEVIDIEETVTQAECEGELGEISVNITGGVEPYQIEWQGIAAPDQTLISDLTPGNYTIVVTDANGCLATESYEIDTPIEIEITENITQPGCEGDLGQIEITDITGGIANYTLNWVELGLNTALVTNLAPGDYTLEVTNADGCTASEVYTITEPGVLDVSVEITQVICNAENNGSITLTASGGEEPYTAAWTPDLGTSLTQTDLAPGTYDVEVSDANGCSFTATYEITEPEALTATETIVQPLCSDGLGSITLEITGGTGNVSIEWDEISANGQSSITDLFPGTYTVTLTDENDCEFSTAYEITAPEEIVATAEITQPGCEGTFGEIELTDITGGSGVYGIEWVELAITDQMLITDLAAGDYTVIITDENDCEFTEVYTITEPGVLDVSAELTHVLCAGENTGSISLSVTGATDPVDFQWTPDQGNTANPTGLAAGVYDVTVTDANGCEFTASYEILEEPELEITESVSQPTCSYDLGTITVAIVGGVEPYEITWDGISADGQTTLIDLFAGSYTANIADANGCTISATYEITVPEEIVITENITQPGCLGTEGQIEITDISGGIVNYTLNWIELGSDQALVENLIPGDYTLEATDANGCMATAVYTITEPGVLDVSAEVVNVSCAGESTGSITLTVVDGVDPVMAVWTPDLGNSLTVSDLAVGVYDVELTDADECSYMNSFEITEPETLTVTENVSLPSCLDPLGEIEIEVSGGTEPYQIEWTGSVTVSNQTLLSDLGPGLYNLAITDANDCVFTADYEITPFEELAISGVVNSPGCSGAVTGDIEITLTGGTEPFDVVWTGAGVDGSDQLFIDNLEPGEYSVAVSDAGGCTAEETFTVLPPGVLSVTPNVVNNACFGDEEGSIELILTGAVEPLQEVTWIAAIPLNDDLTQNDLPSGLYEIHITDADDCSFDSVFEITSPDLLQIEETISSVSCASDLGTIDINIIGGAEPYTITWAGAGVDGSDETAITDLEPGVYSVSIIDANDCTAEETYTVTAPEELELVEDITQPLCFGETGSISVEVTGGTGEYTITWSDSQYDGLLDITDLAAGSYTLTVTDENDCSIEETYEINLIEELQATLNVTQPECFTTSGEAQLTIAGGTEPYSITWLNLPDVQDELLAQEIAPGMYSVTVTDVNSCAEVLIDFEIDEPYSLIVDEVIENVLCNAENTGSIDITVINLTGEPTFLWTNTDTDFTSPTEDIENLPAGTYELSITDELGCVANESYEITENEELVIALVDIQHETCSGEEIGLLNIDINGGTPDYIINWTSGAFTSDQEDLAELAAGEYLLQVSDENGCSAEETFTIDEGAAIDISLTTTDSNCNEFIGAAEIEVTSDNEVQDISWFQEGALVIAGLETELTDLGSGSYSVEVTDINGCSETLEFTISDSDAALIEVAVTDISCFGEEDGAIDVTIISGTEPYELTWSGPEDIAANEYNPTDLMAGEYTAAIIDGEGCNTFEIIEVMMPDTLVIIETVTNVSCNAEEDGSIELDIQGGTEDFTITWSGNGLVSDQLMVSDLTPGTYTVDIVDANGCAAQETYEITEETPLELISDYEEVLCAGVEGTDVDITVTGGLEPYEFSWTGDITSANEDQINLAPGVYTVTVTDAAGCEISEEITITQNTEIEISLTQTEPSCLLNDGSMEATATGGTEMDYSYFWYSTSDAPVLIGQESNIADLEAGTYYLEVFDSAGCFSTMDIELSNNQGEVTAEITDILCAQDATGAIDITVTDMTDPLEFSWSGPNEFASIEEDLTDLEEGDYSVEITDADGCMLFESFTVESTDELEVDIQANNICFGEAASGSISIEIIGGTEPYTVQWDGNGVTSDQLELENLDAGCYNLLVTDANDCSFLTEICISELTEIVLATSVVGNVCYADELGQIDLDVTGGDPDYTFEWTNEADEVISADQNLTELSTGTYSVTVTDDSGCEASTEAVISSNPELVAELEVSPIVCPADENGQIQITYSGGVGNLTLEWTGPEAFNSSDAVLSDLDDGEYCYEITDDIGCSITECINLSDPETLALNATEQDLECFQADDGVITIEPTGGYSPYTQSWLLNTVPFSMDEDIDDLAIGTYEVTLTDSMGCEIIESYEITEPELLTIDFDNIVASTCETSFDGSYEVTASGGVPEYSFSWILAGEEVSADEDPTGLTSGDYTLVLTDQNDCVSEFTSLILPALGNVTVEAPDSIEWCYTDIDQLIVAESFVAASISWENESEEVLSNNDSVYFSETPGVYNLIFIGEDGPCVVTDTTVVSIYELPAVEAGEDLEAYLETDVEIGAEFTTDDVNTVTWSPAELLNDSSLFNPSYFVINDVQQFNVTVTSPEGCVSTDSMTVVLFPELDVHTGFTPNSDGINDTWILGNYRNYPSIEVWVYNRWGEPLFYSAGYDQPWDGTFEGNALPIGTYYYVITIDEPDLQLTIDGPVTILR